MKDRLCTWDRPSVLIAGMTVATGLQQTDTVVMMVDILGRVQLMPPQAIQVLHRPLLTDLELDVYGEEDSIGLMTREGRSEEEMVRYLRGREGRVNG